MIFYAKDVGCDIRLVFTLHPRDSTRCSTKNAYTMLKQLFLLIFLSIYLSLKRQWYDVTGLDKEPVKSCKIKTIFLNFKSSFCGFVDLIFSLFQIPRLTHFRSNRLSFKSYSLQVTLYMSKNYNVKIVFSEVDAFFVLQCTVFGNTVNTIVYKSLLILQCKIHCTNYSVKNDVNSTVYETL